MPNAMRYQPQGRLRINRAHPLFPGLVDVWLPGVSTRGLLSGIDSSTVAGGSVKSTTSGIGFNTTSTGRRYSTTILNNDRCAWVIVAYRDNSTSSNTFSLIRKDGTVTPIQESNGDVRAAFFNPNSSFSSTINYSGGVSPLVNRVNTFCGYLSPEKIGLWVNDNPEGINGGYQGGGGTNPFCIGATENGGEVASQWTVLAVFLWQGPKIPTTDKLRAFQGNPWAMFDSGSASSTYQSAIASQGTAAGSNGNASVTGTSGTGSAGSVSGSGSATSSLTGNSASALSGAVTAGGNAVTSVSGAQASGSAGTVTSSGSANSSVTGTQASGQSGTVTASSAASGTATVSGVSASAQSGSVSPSGNAITAPSGVSASGQSGAVIASAGSAGTATVSGVASSAQTGSAAASGNASTLPVGQMASAQTGTVVAVAGGNANVALTGIAALVQAGTIIAKGNGMAMLAGTTVNGMTGQPSGSGSSQTLLYGAVAYGQSGQASAIGGNGNASVSILGAGAAALVGQVSAAFIPSSIGINITEDMLCKAVRSYILSIRPTQRVIRTPVKLASMPDGPYVSFTPGRRMPLSTNVASYLSGSRSVERAEQMGFQIDCYGEGARDLADTINLLFRDQYAVDQFAQSSVDIAPLYAGDVMQMPFVDDSDQYEERYSFEIFLQINSVVITSQQSCNMLGINILPVETTYPIV